MLTRPLLFIVVAAALAACGPTALARDRGRAAQQGKPLVIELTASWCGPCKKFEREVLTDARVQLALTGVEFARYDIETRDGRVAMHEYGRHPTPTFLAVRGNGKLVGGLRGAAPAARFIEFLEWVQLNSLDEPTLQRRLAADPGPQPRLIAGRWYAMRGQLDRAGAMYDAALAAPADPATRTAVAEAIARLRTW